MKKTYSVLALLLFTCSVVSVAQVPIVNWATTPRLIAHTRFYLQQFGQGPDIGYYPSGDSATYTYSGNRGGDLKHAMNFDQKAVYQLDTATGAFAESMSSLTIQNFDDKNNLLTTLVNNGLEWRYTYDAASNVTTKMLRYRTGDTASPWINESLDSFYYDGSNNITRHVTQYGSIVTPGNWENGTLATYVYDGTGRVANIYSFTASANGWLNESQLINNYINAKVLITTVQVWDTTAGIWQNSTRATGYKSVNNKDSFKHLQYWDTTVHDWAWPGSDSVFKYYNTGQLDSVIGFWNYGQGYSGGSQRYLKHAYTYDTAGHVTKDQLSLSGNYYIAYQDFYMNSPQTVVDRSHGSSGDTIHYSYNSFEQTTFDTIRNKSSDRYYYSIPVISDTTSNFSVTIFPNPSAGDLTIHIVWDYPEPFAIMLLAADGKLVETWQEGQINNYTTTRDISSLPAGMYLLKITSDHKNVVKKIVVLHE